MCKRREFYSCHPETSPATPEDGGSDVGRWYILPDDPVSLALHPAPAASTHRCYNSHLMPATSVNCCLNVNSQAVRGDEYTNQIKKNPLGGRVRYLQCPAGVSVAQLKRLLRAKFGVGPSHPLAILTSSSDDPLHETLTLVDVAYITAWQRTEPLQLFYQIYERASKKIKLDPDSYSSEALSSSEEMPKLEPSVGSEVTNTVYGSSYSTNSLSDYSSAPLLQAFGALGSDSPVKEESAAETSVIETLKDKTAVTGKSFEVPEFKETGDKSVLAAKPSDTVEEIIEPCAKDSQVMVKCESHSKLAQGTVSDSVMNIESAISGSSVVDTIVTYSGAYTTPSNGVNVGVAFMPGELGYMSPAGVPCAIIPSGGCVPMTGSCIPSNTNIPVLCNTDVHRHIGDGVASAVNEWNSTGPLKDSEVTKENSQVPADVSSKSEGVRGSEEDEGKEVQLKISESGVMSVCGRDTTLEGVLNSIESEACELLSKIESGSLCEDFPPKVMEKLAERNPFEAGNGTKKSKTKDRIGEVIRSKGDTKINKDRPLQKVEKMKLSNTKTASLVTQKSESANLKETKVVKPNVNYNVESCPDTSCNNKPITYCKDEPVEKELDMKPQGELQNNKELKDSNTKDSRSSHIPASLTAASMANLNKPHLKVGTSKVSQGEDHKSKEQKPNNGLNSKKDAKQELAMKSSPGSGCRKSSQSYGYKTLKTPPKSWNPTISREQLALVAGKSSIGKGNKEPPRTNKFFKARNAPRFLGNPSAGVKPMYSHMVDSNGSQKRGVVLKLDPKTLGPVSVPVNNDANPPTTVSSSISSVSSVQSTAAETKTQTSLTSQPVDQKLPNSVHTGSLAPEAHAAVSKVEDTIVTNTKAALTLPASITSGLKESTNTSSKVIGNTKTLQDKNTLQHKSTKNGRSSNNNSSTSNRSGKLSSAHTTGSSSKAEVSGLSISKAENKASGGTVGLVGNSMASFVASSNLMNHLKMAVSTGMTTGFTQVKAETVNALTAANTGLQPQQHLTLGSPAVGVSIIPSCGVSFPGAIGTLPLPYYTNPSLAYPAYPYLYQGAETIGLIPPHHSASFIPTFPACLPPRSPLSPRNIGGAKMMPELPLQSSLLPMVPLVSQVPAQTMSPRPMTPPSPRTPTSTQSPRPYPAQSPRQSITNQSSRPLTPQSPKSLSSVQTTRPQTQSPRQLSNLQPAISQSHRLNNTSLLVTQPQCITVSGQSEKFQFGSQQMSSSTHLVPESLIVPNSTSVCPQNSSYKQNACVQTSLSHTLMSPKNACNSLNSSKPHVPQSPRAMISNHPGACLMQVVTPTSSQSSMPHPPQSPKPNRPHTPQSPRSLCSAQGAVMQTHVNRVSQSNSPLSRHQGISQQPELRIANSTKDKAKNVDSIISGLLGGLSNSLPSSVVSSSLYPISPVSSSILTSGLNTSVTSASGNKLHFPHGTHVSVSSNIPPLYQNSIVNSLSLPLTNTLVSPEVSAATTCMSFSLCNSSAALPISLGNVSTSLPVLTYNSSAPSIPTCPVSIPQAFYPSNTALSMNLPPSTLQSISQSLNTTQAPQSASYINVTAGSTPRSSASLVSASTNNRTGFACIPYRDPAVLTMPTETLAFSPIPSSSSGGSVLTMPTSFTTAAVTMPMTTATLVTKSPSVTSVMGVQNSTACTTVPMMCTSVTPLVSTSYVPLSSTLTMSALNGDVVNTSVPLSSISSAPLSLSSMGSLPILSSSPKHTTVPNSSTANTTIHQSSTMNTTVPQSSTASTTIPDCSTASATVPQSSTSTTIPFSTASTTVPHTSTARTTVPHTSTASTIAPQSFTASLAVCSSTIGSTTVPISSTGSISVPQNDTVTTAVSATCMVVASAPSKSTVGTLSSSSDKTLPVSNKEIMTVSPSSKAIATAPVSSTAGTTIVPGSTAGTTITPGSTAGTTIVPGSTVGTIIAPGSTAGTTIVPGSTAGTTIAPGSTAGTTITPGSTTDTAITPGSTADTTIAPGSTAGTTIAPGSTAGTTIAPGSTAGTTIAPDSTAGTTIAPGGTAGTTIAPGSTAGTTIAPGSMAGTTIAPGSTTGSTIAPGSTAGTTITPGSTAGTTIAPGSTAGTTITPGSTAGITIAPGSTAGTTIPVVNTGGAVVSSSSTLDTSISICNTAGITIPVSSTVVVARSQSSGCFAPCGTVGGNLVLSAKERGGSEPQSSACTPVCDVTHVIDAKQQCAEPSVSSSGGPRPCLKS
ncbi:mucin-22 isoform X2 [Procambarus clarkii]|nr:mucin-19-like isoform X2 [Procambarus clarkii]